jgi:sporulation protein YlmC with PRC-barrel domain
MFLQTTSLLAAIALALPQQPDTPAPRGQDRPAQQPPAQQPGTPGTRAEAARANHALQLQRSDKLIGAAVQDKAHSNVAVIDDMILLPNGQIAYGVLSGLEGAGQGKLYAVPWNTLSANPAGTPGTPPQPGGMGSPDKAGQAKEALALSVERDRLFAGPGFDRANWTKALVDREYYTQVDSYYGGSGSRGDGPMGRPMDASTSMGTSAFRASLLRNQPVSDAQGNVVGNLTQVAFDPAGSRINYVAVTLSKTDGGARTIAVPWEALRVSRPTTEPAGSAASAKLTFTMNVPADKLAGAPEFQTGDTGWRQMADPKWVNELYTYYSVRPYWDTTGMTDGTKRPPSDGNVPEKKEPR